MLKTILKTIGALLLLFYATNVTAMKRLSDAPEDVKDAPNETQWAHLPAEVLFVILLNLNLADHANCDSVCRAWHKSLHLKDLGVFFIYDEFKEQFDQLKDDFKENLNRRSLMSQLRCASAKLNRKPEEQFKFVKSLCPDIWSTQETSIMPKLMNKEFKGDGLLDVQTIMGAKLDIEPVWIYLALIRVLDGRISQPSEGIGPSTSNSDVIIKRLPAIKYITNEWSYYYLAFIMPDGYLIEHIGTGSLHDFGNLELCSEYCERKLEMFLCNEETFQKEVNKKIFFIGLGAIIDKRENVSSKLSAPTLLNYGLTYFSTSEETALKFLRVAYTKDSNILLGVESEMLYKFALASVDLKDNKYSIIFCKNALNNDPKKDPKAVVLTFNYEEDDDRENFWTRAVIFYYLAKAYSKLENDEKALKYYEVAISGLEDGWRLDSALFKAGRVCLILGQYKKAIGFFAKTNNSESAKFTANALYLSSDLEGARKEYAKYLSSEESFMSYEDLLNAANAFGVSVKQEDDWTDADWTAIECLIRASAIIDDPKVPVKLGDLYL